MKSTSVAIAVTFATLVLMAAPAELQDRKAGRPSRQRPPERSGAGELKLKAANHLTS